MSCRGARLRGLTAVTAVLLAALPVAPVSARERYSAEGRFFQQGIQDAGRVSVFDWPDVSRDPFTGLPKVSYDGVPHWNPVTVALYGLQHWNRHHAGRGARHLRAARRAGNWLVRSQRPTGEWLYTMRFRLRSFESAIEPRWVAAQAQGNAISLLSRLYRTTRDARYLRAARLAVLPFTRRIRDGGVRRRLGDRVLYEGFPTEQPSFVLEDFQLAVLGLYDISDLDARAQRLFGEGIAVLYSALPLYTGESGMALYDLQHLTMGAEPLASPSAAAFNLAVLRTLETVAPSPRARYWAARWERALAGQDGG